MLRWVMLMVVIVVLPGCALFRALFAPQSVVGDAASRIAGGAAQAIDQAATQQTVSDLDRILANHGDAVNSAELQRLRTDLEENPLAGSRTQTGKPAQVGPPHEFDRRRATKSQVTPSESLPPQGSLRLAGAGQKQGNRLAVSSRTGSTHRGQGEPFAASRGHLLPPAEQRIYQVEVRQVRASPSRDAGARREDP